MSDERDDVVERVLKALGRAEVPEGLEARIAQRVERREIVAGPSMAGVWWRGAFSGAAVALFAVGMVMVVGHSLLRPVQIPAQRGGVAVGPVSAASTAVGLVEGEGLRVPCASARSRVVHASAERQDGGWQETGGKRQPMPWSALTAEERGLVRVVQAADPKELAMLNPEMREQREAEDAAQFQSFFAERVVMLTPAEPAAAEPSAAVPAVEPAAAEPAANQIPTEQAPGGNQ